MAWSREYWSFPDCCAGFDGETVVVFTGLFSLGVFGMTLVVVVIEAGCDSAVVKGGVFGAHEAIIRAQISSEITKQIVFFIKSPLKSFITILSNKHSNLPWLA
jgi:hypothetical protein